MINDIPIAMLDEVERKMYKQKLLIEIAHFKQREELYAEKRDELLQLEMMYRKNQKNHVKTRDAAKDRGDTQGLMLTSYQDKIVEGQRKLGLKEDAIADLEEKLQEVKDQVRQRQLEINEMKRAVEQ